MYVYYKIFMVNKHFEIAYNLFSLLIYVKKRRLSQKVVKALIYTYLVLFYTGQMYLHFIMYTNIK